MDKKELLKKYWFLGVIALALFAFICLYAADSYKNREILVNNKMSDGKYVAYTIDDEPVFADDLYDILFETDGMTKFFAQYQKAVVSNAYETTDEMKSSASVSAANILSAYSQDYVLSVMKSMGYDDGVNGVVQYYIDAQKHTTLLKEYVEKNAETYLDPVLGTNGRLIYHILVKCDTTPVLDEDGNVIAYEAAPTEEQKAKLDSILEYLSNEENSFEYTAYQYSEDTGSAQYGGYIGLINEENASVYDSIFAKTSLSLKDGEVSEPIVSQFGYHIIKDAGSTADALFNDNYYLSEFENDNQLVVLKALLDKGAELGFEIKDERINALIDSQLNAEEEN